MADGSIRINVKISNDDARTELMKLLKSCESVTEKIKETGKNTSLNIDIKQAEKSIAKLDKEIENYQKKLADLSNRKLGEYNSAKEQIEAEAYKDLAQAKTDEQAKVINEMADYQLAQLNEKYKTVIAQADEYSKKIEEAKQEQERLNHFINDSQNPVEKVEQKFHTIRDAIAAAGREAKNMELKPYGEYAADGFEKMLNTFDNIKNKATSTGQKIKEGLTNGFEFLRNGGLSKLVQSGADKLVSFRDRVNEAIGRAGEKFGELPMKARDAGIRAAAFIRNAFRNLKNTELNINTESIKSGLTSLVSKVKSGLTGALKGAWNIAKKLGSAFVSVGKTIASKIGGGLKNAMSRMKSLGKSADGMRKKFLRVGLAMVGMRSLLAGLRQLVSSALSNNEKLQNQLTAIKGVMGEALAPAMEILIQGLSKIVSFADKLYQIFTGTSLIAKYNAKQSEKMAENTADAAEAAKEYENQLSGFDEVNKLSDNSSSSSSSSSSDSDTASLFEATDLSGWMKKIIEQMKSGDWAGVGETIANGINSALSKIDWSSIQEKVKTFCTNLGNSVNGFVHALDWNKVGNSIGEGLNTLISGINSFVDTVKWESVGTGISTGLNSIISKIDANELGKILSAKLKILTDSLYGFFNGDGENGGFNFSDLGKKLGDSITAWFNNIDWKKAGSNISSAISGLGDMLSGMFDNINWNDGEDSLTQKIKDFFGNIKWGEILKSVCTALGEALGGLGSTVVQLLKDAWNDWKAQYIDSAIEEAGGNIIEGVLNGIFNWWKDCRAWCKEKIFDPFIEGFKSTFNIHSPSKNEEILDLGRNIIEGAFNGIVDWLKGIGSWLKTNVFDKITDAWKGMKELTVSIGGKIQDSFTKLKEKWDSVKDKVATLTNEVKEKAKNALDNLKTKWDGLKSKTATLTNEVKEKVKNALTNLKDKWDGLKNKNVALTNEVKEKTKNAVSNLKSNWDSFKNKTVTVTAEIKDKASSVFKNIANSFIDYINKAIDKINSKLKISVGDTLSKILNAIGIKVTNGSYQLFTIPSIPKLAKGGIVNNPGRGVTVTAGEAGPEAVLPLNEVVLAKLGEMIGDHMKSATGQVVIPIYLDSKKLATYLIDAQNRQAFALNKGGAY